MDGLGELPLFPEGTSWEAVWGRLEEFALNDGLPMVPPTGNLLEEMLGSASGSRSHGQLPPLFGDLTATAVAYQCVLAGCEPGVLPLVLAAATACLEAKFNLLGLLTTTGTPAVMAIVHGGCAEQLGMNGGSNCLGPGNRSNATLGRAIALIMRNIGGARPGIGDMATMGQPGKYGVCVPESNEGILPSLSVRRGCDGDAVTVLGISGTIEVLPEGDGNAPEVILAHVGSALAAARTAASAGQVRDLGEQFFLLPPELARQIAKRGWDLTRIQSFLFGEAEIAKSPQDIHPIITGGPGVKMTCLPLWAGGTLSVTKPLSSLGS